jgi:hypothetical protein
MMAATVEADVTVDSVTGSGDLATALSAITGTDPIAGLEQTEGLLTHYQQIIINLP